MTFKLIKTGALAVALLVAPFAAAAEAADMRVKAPVYKGVPRSVISYYNWTGIYVGLNVGYGTGTSEWETLRGRRQAEGHDLRRDARLQLAGRLVGVRHRRRLQPVGHEGQRHVRGGPHLRNREHLVRHLPRPRRLRVRPLHALPHRRRRLRQHQDVDQRLGAVQRPTKSKFGYTFGAGLEYAFLGNWTGKVEYLYLNLGSHDNGFTAPVANNVSFDASIVRVGLNYKFGGGGW